MRRFKKHCFRADILNHVVMVNAQKPTTTLPFYGLLVMLRKQPRHLDTDQWRFGERT